MLFPIRYPFVGRSRRQPPDSSMHEFLVIYIDINTFEDYDCIMPDQQFQISISILDTRHLHGLVTVSTISTVDIIKSYQFHTRDYKYC